MTPDTKPSSPNPTTLTSLDKLLSQEAEQKIHPPLYRILTGEFKSRVDAVRVTVVDTKRVLSQEATEFIENEWARGKTVQIIFSFPKRQPIRFLEVYQAFPILHKFPQSVHNFLFPLK